MKRSCILILALALLLLAGCGGPDTDTIEGDLPVYPLELPQGRVKSAKDFPQEYSDASDAFLLTPGEVYTLDGKVTSYFTTDNDRIFSFTLVSSHCVISVCGLGAHTGNEKTSNGDIMDDQGEYTIPAVGTKAKVVILYGGVSDITGSPTFYYGARQGLINSVQTRHDEGLDTDGESIYPQQSTSKYIDAAEQMTDKNNPAVGNPDEKLGCVYSVSATVKTVLDASQMEGLPTFILSTEFGDLAVVDLYSVYSSKSVNGFAPESDADYSIPPAGTKGTFIITFCGALEDGTTMYFYGANESMVEMVRG